MLSKGATAFALRPLQQTHAGPSNQIAVATRTGRRNVRIVVFELFSTLGSSSPVVARSDRVHPQLAAVQVRLDRINDEKAWANRLFKRS